MSHAYVHTSILAKVTAQVYPKFLLWVWLHTTVQTAIFNTESVTLNLKRENPETVGSCLAFFTVIILYFIHIRTWPPGTRIGNTDRACVVLQWGGKSNLVTGTSIILCFLCVCHQRETLYFTNKEGKRSLGVLHVPTSFTCHMSKIQNKNKLRLKCASQI